jgi:Holliday junction resolvase
VSSYSRGVYFERRVRDDLKARGYDVQRSPMSRGPADLTANRTDGKLYVQAKFTGPKADTAESKRGYLSVVEWNLLYAKAYLEDAKPIVAFNTTKGKITYRLLLKPKQDRRRQPWTEFEP